MSKSKLMKRLISIIAFIIIITVTFATNIAANSIFYNGMSLDTLIYKTQNATTDEWFGFNPNEVAGTKLNSPTSTLNKANSRCLHPATVLNEDLSGSYSIVHIVDVNVEDNKISIYSKNNEVKTYDISNEKTIPLLMLSYLTKKADEKGSTHDYYNEYRYAIYQLFMTKSFANDLKDLGISKAFGISGNQSGLGNYKDIHNNTYGNRVMIEAYKEALKMQQANSGSEKSSLSLYMSEKEKQNVRVFEQDGKTYIGPYKIKLDNGCTVKEINIINKNNQNISVDNISTDKSTTKSIGNINSKEEFYIVTDAKINEIQTIELKGNTTQSSFKSRMVFCGQSYNQNYLIWKNTNKPSTPKVSLPVPENGTLEIIKNDQYSTSINLSGIGFKVYKEGSGWLKEDGTYGYFKDGKEFLTGWKYDYRNNKENKILDRQGNVVKNQIVIDGIPLGNYRVYETSIPESLQKYYKLGKLEFTTKYATKDTPRETDWYDAELVKKDVKIDAANTYTVTHTNKRAYADFQIKKVDKADSTKELEGIAFKLASVDKNGIIKGWVTWDDKNVVTKTNASFDEAKRLVVKKDNVTEVITKLPIGKYQIFETEIGEHPEYTLDSYIQIEDKKIPVSDKGIFDLHANQKGTTVVKTIENEQQFISISGIVWEDVPQNKTDRLTTVNNNNNELDSNDYRINGIKVKLVDNNGKDVQGPITTGIYKYKGKEQNGVYRFDNVKISELKNYHVEFSYDGITYQSVETPQDITDIAQRSSATETEKDRNDLNYAFSVITGEGQKVNYKGKEYTLSYNKTFNKVVDPNTQKEIEIPKVVLNNICDRETGLNTTNKVVDLKKDGDFIVTSKTANNLIIDQYNKDKSVTEITDINFGLCERLQADLGLRKDLSNADVSINGITYRYDYNQYDKNVEDIKKTIGENVDTTLGVRFQAKENVENYNLPIYTSDVVYENDDKSKELNVSLTYKITLENNSNILYSRINSIKEIFSKDMTFEELYKLDANGNKVSIYNATHLNEQNIATGDKYSQITFGDLGIQIAPHKNEVVYITFKLPKDGYYDADNKVIFKDNNFENHAEIASYSMSRNIENGKFEYACYDINSIPNNYNPATKANADEDDSDFAPGLKIVDAGIRTIKGTVFEDTDDNPNDNERLGNGVFDENENKVKGVKVRLIERLIDTEGKEEGKEAPLYDLAQRKTVEQNAVTNENGEYEISGFIPGDYTIQFTWGEGEGTTINGNTVTVDKYKSTIWTPENRAEKAKGNEWYKFENPRYSDALDNYKARLDLDKNTKSLEQILESQVSKSSMIATTNELSVGICYNAEGTVGNTPVKEFNIVNVDFGLIERPILAIDVEKNVNSIKIDSLTDDGDIDVTMNKQGKLVKTGTENQEKGEVVSGVKGGIAEGFIQIEKETNLVQGAEMQVGYKVKVKNVSEDDYATKEYYLYGEKGNAEKITLTATNLYDYLRNLGNDAIKNNNTWDSIGNAELKDKLGTTVIDKLVANSISNQNENAVKQTLNINEKTANKIADWILEYNLKNNVNTVQDLTNISSDAIRSIKCEGVETSINKDTTFELESGKEYEYDFYAKKLIASDDSLVFENDVEIGNVVRNSDVGRSISLQKSNLYNMAQPITITPPTGEDRNITPIIVIAISAIAVLGAGIVVIKKTVLKK